MIEGLYADIDMGMKLIFEALVEISVWELCFEYSGEKYSFKSNDNVSVLLDGKATSNKGNSWFNGFFH